MTREVTSHLMEGTCAILQGANRHLFMMARGARNHELRHNPPVVYQIKTNNVMDILMKTLRKLMIC